MEKRVIREIFEVSILGSAIDSLEKVLFFLNQKEDPFRWKWAAIAVDHTLYEFGLTCLAQPNPDWVKKDEKGNIIGFDEVLKRVQNKRFMIRYVISNSLKLSKTKENNIKKLHKYWRNFFAHQKPTTIFFAEEDVKPLVRDTIDAIEFLALKSGNVLYYDPLDRNKVKSVLLNIKDFLKKEARCGWFSIF